MGLHGELFRKLTPQCVWKSFTLVNLASGEFPQATVMLRDGALADQYALITSYDCGNNHRARTESVGVHL